MPQVARPGRSPPPASRDGHRSLSTLGTLVVESDPAAASATPPGPAAQRISPAEQYVLEREQKRLKGFDIPNHSRYKFTSEGEFRYAGMRTVNGQPLALLRSDGEISVLEVDQKAARQLKRKSLDDLLIVSATGVIKFKGRAR